ncbi:MAG: adenine phosphoribosyltransferase, partial [Bacteroidota bacterium]
MRLADAIRTVPDFPKPGIQFKDVTPLLADPALLVEAVDRLVAPYADAGVTHVVGIESRGFILGAMMADRLGAGFVPVRKPGKLPGETARESYALEYGSDALDIH